MMAEGGEAKWISNVRSRWSCLQPLRLVIINLALQATDFTSGDYAFGGGKAAAAGPPLTGGSLARERIFQHCSPIMNLSLCPNDDIVSTLRSLFGANVVRVPEERIRPLVVLAHRGDKTTVRGELAPLLVGGALGLGPDDFGSSRVADLSGRRSRKVDVELGLNILDGFLRGLGVPSAAVEGVFARDSEVSFTFANVNRTFLDTGVLGQRLRGRHVDRHNSAAAIYFGDSPHDLLVIDSVITSRNFTITVERSSGAKAKLDVSAVQKFVGEATAGVKVSSATGYDLTFEGPEQLSFAFSCVKFYLNKNGVVQTMPPAVDVAVLGIDSVDASVATVQYGPDRVLLNVAPEMIELYSVTRPE